MNAAAIDTRSLRRGRVVDGEMHREYEQRARIRDRKRFRTERRKGIDPIGVEGV
jgi:hypothetical protein